MSYSGVGGYVIFEPIVEGHTGLIKVLVPVPDVRSSYRMDFHLLTIGDEESFASLGHRVHLTPTSVYLDGEELHRTDQVPSPVRSPISQTSSLVTEQQPEFSHEFCELAN